MSSDSFSASSPAQRVAALLDPGSFRGIADEARGALTAGTGGVGDTAVAIAATDRHIAGGSFGVVESQALSALLQHSRNDGVPVILCLDSAGARLDEGLPRSAHSASFIAIFSISGLPEYRRSQFWGATALAVPACWRRPAEGACIRQPRDWRCRDRR